MIDDTAKAILENADEIVVEMTLKGTRQVEDLQAMARLWLLLPEIRAWLTDDEEPFADVQELLTKLSDESLQGKL